MSTPSIREKILLHLKSVAEAAFPGVAVTRARTWPAEKNVSLAIQFRPTDEQTEQLPAGRTRRTMTVVFSLFVRSRTPEEAGDTPLTTLTSAVLADIRCGGFATQIQETSTSWDFDTEVSEDYGEITVSFSVEYFTTRADQTVQA